MSIEHLSVTGHVAAGADGRPALMLDAQRCPSCVGCLWRAPKTVGLRELCDTRALVPGARLTVRLPASVAVVGTLLLYGVPLAALLIGALLGAGFGGEGDLSAVIGAGTGLCVAVVALRRVRKRCERAISERLSIEAQ